jgi:hypothetical protein
MADDDRKTDPSELRPDPETASPAHVLSALLGHALKGMDAANAYFAYLQGFERRQAVELHETLWGGLSRQLDTRCDGIIDELRAIELRAVERQAAFEGELREHVATIKGLVQTLTEERLVDRQTLVDLAKWKTAHERGNAHCETCPYQQEAATGAVVV